MVDLSTSIETIIGTKFAPIVHMEKHMLLNVKHLQEIQEISGKQTSLVHQYKHPYWLFLNPRTSTAFDMKVGLTESHPPQQYDSSPLKDIMSH